MSDQTGTSDAVPVTHAEEIYRESQRARYEPLPTYTPDNADSAVVNASVERENETRLNHIRETLLNAHNRLQDNRAFAVQEGRAVAEFNQSSQSSAPSTPSATQDMRYER